MAKMCPMDGCKKKQGLCMHDKVMIAMVVLMVLGAGGFFLLGGMG